MMRSILLILLTLSLNCFAQLDDNTKAKLYFVEAEKYFNQNDYEQAIKYVEKAEQELGSPNARILNLKIKAYYNDGKFEKAENAFNLFINEYQSNATEEMKNETLSYFVRIEKAVEEQKKEEEKLAEIKRKKEEEEKKLKEEIEFLKSEHKRISGGVYHYKPVFYDIDEVSYLLHSNGKKYYIGKVYGKENFTRHGLNYTAIKKDYGKGVHWYIIDEKGNLKIYLPFNKPTYIGDETIYLKSVSGKECKIDGKSGDFYWKYFSYSDWSKVTNPAYIAN